MIKNLFIYIFIPLNIFATSYAPPTEKEIHSENRNFLLHVNPETSIHTIYDITQQKRQIWSFKRDVWHDRYFINNRGTLVVWLSWKFCRVDDLDNPCIIVYNTDGTLFEYSYREVSKPRKYNKGEVGPIGNFWRIWYEEISYKDETIIIKAPNNKVKVISLSDGKLK
jgi:hypothetical protein